MKGMNREHVFLDSYVLLMQTKQAASSSAEKQVVEFLEYCEDTRESGYDDLEISRLWSRSPRDDDDDETKKEKNKNETAAWTLDPLLLPALRADTDRSTVRRNSQVCRHQTCRLSVVIIIIIIIICLSASVLCWICDCDFFIIIFGP
jgi:hypothetical protein